MQMLAPKPLVDEWEDASCRRSDVNPEWWNQLDPTDEDEPPWIKVFHRRALLFCKVCPVREECLEEALKEGYEQYHIRGGMTEQDRKKLLVKMEERAS